MYPVAPQPLQSIDHTWVLQTIMELQKSNGEVTQTLRGLTEQIKSQGDKLERVSEQVTKAKTVIITAGLIGSALLSILVYLIDKGLDFFARVNP